MATRNTYTVHYTVVVMATIKRGNNSLVVHGLSYKVKMLLMIIDNSPQCILYLDIELLYYG